METNDIELKKCQICRKLITDSNSVIICEKDANGINNASKLRGDNLIVQSGGICPNKVNSPQTPKFSCF